MLRNCALLMLLAFSVSTLYVAAKEPADSAGERSRAQQQMNDGNYRDAYELFSKRALDPETDPKQVGSDLTSAIQCLSNLNRVDEIDEFRERVIAVHHDNWRLLHTAAQTYAFGVHHGYLVAGEFHRGNKRGGGDYVNSVERDRVRALQLLQQAKPLVAESDADASARSQFYLDFANILLNSRGYQDAWRLQYLTDLADLPDYEEVRYYIRAPQDRGAPVDADGNPVFHHLPDSYETAATDGERWRWMLHQAVEVSPGRKNQVRMQFAGFLQNQFGVGTMRGYPRLFQGHAGDDDDQDESGPYALHTLEDDETIARLANGVKRFRLPEEFNFLRIYKQIADDEGKSYAEQALNTLAQIFEDRRQNSKAAEYWQRSIREHGPGNNNYKQKRLEQIVGNLGRFENATVHPAGQGATVDFRFRNGTSVTFTAWSVDIEKLLGDVKKYLRSNPRQLQWEQVNLEDIGHRLVALNQKKYLKERVANWKVDLEPRENHYDKRITVTTPLEKAGAYLLTGKMADGNTSRIIVWVSDTVIARKQLDGKMLYYVADAVTGEPIEKANVEFFGYEQKHVRNNVYQVTTSNFAEFTNADGQVIPDPETHSRQYQWVATARKSGRLAYLGFSGVWYGRAHDAAYNQTKVFVATDRPVYRPEQTLKFNVWVRNAQYDKDDVSQFANRNFTLRITNPKGDAVLEKSVETDEFGGFSGEFEITGDATLGQYHIGLAPHYPGGISFRVEEYKKPEFEVSVDSPDEPVMLGEKVTAKIAANYYFGAPVTNAEVHYKVTRTAHTSEWFPPRPWDWFYGPGYWWFSPDYDWYPGWNRWGCAGPRPAWWPQRHDPPEVVLNNVVPIGTDGTVEVEIDTALAKEIHGDEDHRYEITAEVVDASRRTIVGTGEVLVARKPFKVFAWVDRGYYRTGDVVEASFKAQTLARKPVAGDGSLKLLKITYNENSEPVETEVADWDLDTNDRGEASVQFNAAEPGQYRLSYAVTDDEGHEIEGGYLFNVVGDNSDGSPFRYDDLELILDKQHYEPGDTVRLLINTNRKDQTLLLFVRPTNGVYPRPQTIRLDGKSTVHEIAVAKKDMPNFFVEAMAVSNGKLHTVLREVIVPPEKRIANIEVLPSATEYKPGESAKVRFKLTDMAGNPFVGSTAVSVYDKSVEYISGGTNVADIREFFWKWRRSHHPSTYSSLDRYFSNLLRSGELSMNNIGAFGHLIFDREDADGSRDEAEGLGGGGFGGRRERMLGLNMVPNRAKSQAGASIPMFEMAADAAAPQEASSGAEMVQPSVRTQFADTAYWMAGTRTDENGIVEISLDMPENLTTWKIRAWSVGHGTVVGQGEGEVITTKNLLVRLQAPRFFTETDEVVLSAIVHNYLDTAKTAQVVLELEGGTLEPIDSLTSSVEIEAGGEARVDWRVKAVAAGDAVVRMKALTDQESDAMQMTFPVYVHGMLKTESYTGVIRPEQNSASIEIEIPSERKPEQSRLEVRYSPTLAGAMVDALPYLVEYPYGCTEQTLNRFVPTVITQNILKRMNLDLAAIQEKRTNLNAQEIGDDRQRAEGWKRYPRNPVFDEAEVSKMVKSGVKKLTEMQLSDGGWGWFSGWGERSYPHTTALVVHGLQVAEANGVAIVPGVKETGIEWLKQYQAEQTQKLKNADSETKPYKTHADNIDAFVFMVLVDADSVDREMLDFLYRDRTKLSVYAKGMFGLALHAIGDEEKLAMIVENIDQFLVQDDENQTAYLKLPGSYWWYWYGSEIEANAYYLKLLARTDPRGVKASRLVKYLLNNRKHATYWNSTRDTAIAIEAMAEYMTASGEDRPDMTVDVLLDGEKVQEVQINADNLFHFDNKFVLTGVDVPDGRHTVELRKQGDGPLYFNAYVTNFTKEKFIEAAGLEIKVHRKYYRLIRQDEDIKVAGSRGQAVDQRVEKYKREELKNHESLASGDLIEIELVIESKNDYEYLVFEDMKAAGFEPVELTSGYSSNGLGAYVEYRDEQVNFFVRWLARGKHSVSYRMRAEVPGKFSALPTKGYAMYAPELRANSDEIKLSIADRSEPLVGAQAD